MLPGFSTSIPMHRVDAPGLYVFPHDDAWDLERIAAEREELVALRLGELRREAAQRFARRKGMEAEDLSAEDRELAEGSVELTVEERAAAADLHPVSRYFAGETRFDPLAPMQGPRGLVQVSEYFRPGSRPVAFHLRRVGYAQRVRLDPLVERDPAQRWTGWIRAGVERITCGGEALWQASAGQGELSEEWIERIAGTDTPALNLIYLSGAVARYSAPITSAEGKRSA